MATMCAGLKVRHALGCNCLNATESVTVEQHTLAYYPAKLFNAASSALSLLHSSASQ